MHALTAALPHRSPGEIHELKEELNNPKMEKKKDAVKKVIAAMTVGKDVSMLFPQVVNCMQTCTWRYSSSLSLPLSLVSRLSFLSSCSFVASRALFHSTCSRYPGWWSIVVVVRDR